MEEKKDDEEKEKADYFYKLICLVVDLGTEVLLKLFLKDIPQGQTVEQFLNSKANVLNRLKNQKVFNDFQIGILNAASPDVSRFDISLLYILICKLSNIQSPIGGWYIACPIPSDPSAGALLMNLRRIRNEAIAHWPKCKMKKSDFEKYWNEATDILIELAGEVGQADKDSVKEEIDIIKMKQLGDMGNKHETLLLWARQDQYCEILSSIGVLNKKIDQHGSVLGDIGPLKSSIQAVEAHINTTVQQFDQQSKVLEDIKTLIQTMTDQKRQFPGTSSESESEQHRRDNEEIKTSIQTIADQLKTLLNQNRSIPGPSSGTEFPLPEVIYTRPKKRVAEKPVAKRTKSEAKRVKKSKEDNGNFAPDLEESEYFIAKTKLRREIMDHYKETGCSTTAVPALMDGEEVHIDEIFVMPSMRVRKNMATGRESRNSKPGSSEVITTIHELYQKDGQPIRRVCISGDAGQGKTTLCQKIVSTWCKVHSNTKNVTDTEQQFLKSFDLLLYLPLRNQKTSDVIEMIKTEIVRESSHNAVKQVLEKESEKCLIILDGLDEWLPSEDCKHKVPYIDPREKFSVLITSRPWKLEVLRPKISEIGQDVELNGIKDDKLIEAVVNVLNNKYAKEINWEHFKYRADICYEFNETYEKVNYLAEVPVILTQMVCMWYDEEEFGNTRVEIYSKMLDYLFHMADKRHQEVFESQGSTNTQLLNVFKDFKYCQVYSEILYKLSDLAYHTLFNAERENSLVFPHSVTEIYKLTENDVKLCLKVGILSQTKLCKASSHKKSISFLHKTFQEFLAALYIAFVENDGSFNEMLDTLISLDVVFEMSEVLTFLSGLRPDLIGDMSRHIAQLTDKDEKVLEYRNSITDRYEKIIDRLQDIIYNCIVDIPKHRMLDTKVELHDVYCDKELIYEKLKGDKIKKIIPYVTSENVKVLCNIRDVPSEYWTTMNDLVKLVMCIESQEDIDHMTSTVERCASSLTCLSFSTFSFCTMEDLCMKIPVNIDNFLTALKKVSHLTCVEFEGVTLTHSDIEYLGTTLSQSTQLKEICLDSLYCRTCQFEQCNYRIDLSHHKQLQYLSIHFLDGDIILSNEVPVEHCEISDVNCAGSILDTLKFSTHLHELHASCFNSTNSVTSSITTVQDDERDVHPTTLCLSELKVLTDVIPTLKNLRKLDLSHINFKKTDILRLSPEMTSLKNVSISYGTMALQCLQGFIDSLPQTQFNVWMFCENICPKEDTSTALKYITDRHQVSISGFQKAGLLDFNFTNRPSH